MKQQENQYYLEKMPYTMAPLPPQIKNEIIAVDQLSPQPYSISRMLDENDDNDHLYAKVGH